MPSPGALYVALDLVERPTLVGVMRQRPLPPEILTLIRIAADSPETLRESSSRVGKDPALVRFAAIFYIQQVLWADGADYYRVLGVGPSAPSPRVAEHVRWFMKWLHPDALNPEVKPGSTVRVLKAWDALKTPDRRRRYNQLLAAQRRISPADRRAERRRAPSLLQPVPWVASSETESSRPWAAQNWRTIFAGAAALLAVAIAGAMLLAGSPDDAGIQAVSTSAAESASASITAASTLPAAK